MGTTAPFIAGLTGREEIAARLVALARQSAERSSRWQELSQQLRRVANGDPRWGITAQLVEEVASQEQELAQRISETARRYREGQSLVPPWSEPLGRAPFITKETTAAPPPHSAPPSVAPPPPHFAEPAPGPPPSRPSPTPASALTWKPFPPD